MSDVLLKVANSKSLITEGYVTFSEAGKIVKPLIGDVNFVEFLQEEGYLNDCGLPTQSTVEDSIFHVWHYTKPNEVYPSFVFDVFLTPYGLMEITENAIKKYLHMPKTTQD